MNLDPKIFSVCFFQSFLLAFYCRSLKGANFPVKGSVEWFGFVAKYLLVISPTLGGLNYLACQFFSTHKDSEKLLENNTSSPSKEHGL